MANFTIRVELHEVHGTKPSGEDYQDVHLAMQRKSYFRVIKSGDDEWYLLPPAEYTVAWDVQTKAVLDEVTDIVKTVWNKYSVLVTMSDGRHWYNLQKISAERANQLRDTNV